MIFLLNQKPDTSLAQKSGHFYLLTTLPVGRLLDRNPRNVAERIRENAQSYRFGGNKWMTRLQIMLRFRTIRFKEGACLSCPCF